MALLPGKENEVSGFTNPFPACIKGHQGIPHSPQVSNLMSTIINRFVFLPLYHRFSLIIYPSYTITLFNHGSYTYVILVFPRLLYKTIYMSG
jgi:hypothetical protein